MRVNPVNMSIADFCASLDRRESQIDKRYQRSSEVWPVLARSFLIETILKGFPIPKLTIHQSTDLKSRKTIKFIVDGQQRSAAINAFFRNELRLPKSLSLPGTANAIYAELTEDLQEAFLSYTLSFDQFEGATDEDIREYYQRINSFTAPLNPEEQRHAKYQGSMKWFIHSLAQHHTESIIGLGALADRSVVRMSDAKFLAEVVHALLKGIMTTSKTILDSMYGEFEKSSEVDLQEEIARAIRRAIDVILDWRDLQHSSLMKTHIFYSLLLAVIAVQQHWSSLKSLIPVGQLISDPVPGLLRLASAVDDPDNYRDLKAFTDACADRTNVKSQRETRVVWLAKALVGGGV